MAAARPKSGSGVKTDNKCKGKLEAKTILHTEKDYFSADNNKTALEKHMRLDKRQVSWCLTGLALFLHLLSEGVEKA